MRLRLNLIGPALVLLCVASGLSYFLPILSDVLYFVCGTAYGVYCAESEKNA
jgi:hypothetical protein